MAKKTKPYISLNKLAEYMQADSVRRRSIISILKKDRDYFKHWYSQVRNVLLKYFKSDYSEDLIQDRIKYIESLKKGTKWEDADQPNSIKALENLIQIEFPDFTDYLTSKNLIELKEIEIAGVRITIKPEFFIKNKSTGRIGAVKFHIAKTPGNWLNDESMDYAAGLIKYSLIAHGIPKDQIENDGCISVDIFSQKWRSAPTAYKQRIKRLEAACEEIYDRWDSFEN